MQAVYRNTSNFRSCSPVICTVFASELFSTYITNVTELGVAPQLWNRFEIFVTVMTVSPKRCIHWKSLHSSVTYLSRFMLQIWLMMIRAMTTANKVIWRQKKKNTKKNLQTKSLNFPHLASFSNTLKQT